jgi:wyosine [tRNA(Phe)-imidazoG37] synthetase (radical SAM superfamily)
MADTFLFDKIVFGPIQSRRLGTSLGVNLLPIDCKLCNFNCLYCECGWSNYKLSNKSLPSLSDFYDALEKKLQFMHSEGKHSDVITFAGNGEPTIHPEFAEIIDATIELRNKYSANAKVAVLSNATMLHKPKVVNALLNVDQNIQKIDSAIEKTYRLINQAKSSKPIETIIEEMQSFNGKVIVQTLFLKGSYNGEIFDNTTPEELQAWLDALRKVNPAEIMVYSISRATPHKHLEAIDIDTLNIIANKAIAEGFKLRVNA